MRMNGAPQLAMRSHDTADSICTGSSPISSAAGRAISCSTATTTSPIAHGEPGRLHAVAHGVGAPAGAVQPGRHRGRAVDQEVAEPGGVGEQQRADRQPAQLGRAEVADDRRVDEDVQRLGRQRRQRGQREREDLPVGRAGHALQICRSPRPPRRRRPRRRGDGRPRRATRARAARPRTAPARRTPSAPSPRRGREATAAATGPGRLLLRHARVGAHHAARGAALDRVLVERHGLAVAQLVHRRAARRRSPRRRPRRGRRGRGSCRPRRPPPRS